MLYPNSEQSLFCLLRSHSPPRSETHSLCHLFSGTPMFSPVLPCPESGKHTLSYTRGVLCSGGTTSNLTAPAPWTMYWPLSIDKSPVDPWSKTSGLTRLILLSCLQELDAFAPRRQQQPPTIARALTARRLALAWHRFACRRKQPHLPPSGALP